MRTGAGEEFLNPTKHEGCLATFSSASSNLFKNKNDPDEVIEEVFLQYANGSDSMNREEFAEFIKAQSWLLNKIKEWFKVDSWTTGIKLKLKNPEDFFFSPHLNFTVTAEVSKGKEFFNVHLQLKETFLLTFNENKVLSEVYFIESCKFKAKSKTLSIIYNTLSDQRLTLTFETEEMCQKVKQALEKAGNYKNFKDFYSIGEKIGSGEFASVYLCSEISTGEKFVVKIIKKWKMDKNERDMIKAEIEILNHCCGIAAARLKEVFDTHKNVKIVMEYLSGTDLYTKIKEESTDEVTVKQVIRKTLKNLEFLHLMGVMHRDIKPENLLVHDKNDKLQVRFLDFGLSTFFLPGEKKRNQYGTLSYMAPEVLKGRYCEKIDVWSVGVVLYVYLSGKLPFSSHSQEGLLELIKNEEPNFELELWEQFSLEAKEFTKALLNKNPELRPSCEQALKHKWMSD